MDTRTITMLLALLLAGCASRAPAVPDNADRAVRTEANGDVIDEFRVGGVLRMVKVTPHIGVPYYLVDRNGDGRLEVHGEAPGVYFKLYSW